MSNRSVIVKSATQLFLQSSYSEVSVREISVLSGVSNTYVHKLFGSKESLYMAVLQKEDHSLSEAIMGFDGEASDLLMRLCGEPVPFLSLICSSANSSATRKIVSKYLVNTPGNSLLKIERLFEDASPHSHLWPLYLTTIITSSRSLDLTYLGFTGKSDVESILLRDGIKNFFSGYFSTNPEFCKTTAANIGHGNA